MRRGAAKRRDRELGVIQELIHRLTVSQCLQWAQREVAGIGKRLHESPVRASLDAIAQGKGWLLASNRCDDPGEEAPYEQGVGSTDRRVPAFEIGCQ